jgi:uncharacterized protein
MSNTVSGTASTIDEPYLGPVRGGERYNSLDVVRGAALFGILLMNIIGFGHGLGSEQFQLEGAAQGPNFWIWVVTNTYWEGTQRTLFSLLFGAGVIILTSRAEQSGGGIGVADIYYRRNIWLIVFGMINSYILLWDGDILYYYGIAALFLFPLRNMHPRYLLMIGALGLAMLIVQYQYDAYEIRGEYADFLEAKAVLAQDGKLTEEQEEAVETWEEKIKNSNYNAEDYSEAIEEHTGSYATVFMRHLPGLTDSHGNATYRFMFLDGFSIMVIGMALLKLGILTMQRPARVYWLMMLIGYGIGLPLNAWETSYMVINNYTLQAWMEISFSYDIGRLANATGHLGLLLLFVRSGWLPELQERIAGVGRMALTNYIMHSVICAFIFFGIGLGLYGYFERYQLYFIVALICLFQLLVSKPWLDRYRFGPLEWIWRSLTYMEKQPMVRQPRAI